MNTYLLYKAIHLIGVVCWFAGLFYEVRLFVYIAETEGKDEPIKTDMRDQFNLMAKRLWLGITVPSMWLTTIFGALLWWKTSAHGMPWFHLKLFMLFLLFSYHFRCGQIRIHLLNRTKHYTSKSFRIWNEVATVLLCGIVFIAVLKNLGDWVWAMTGLVIFFIVLIVAIKFGKRVGGK